jgi:ketosteroid isomerase-like protein
MTSSEESKQLVLASYRAFAAQETEKIASFFAPDAQWIVPEGNATVIALGRSSGWVGRGAIVRYLTEEIRRLFSDAKSEVLSVTADGEHVVVEHRFEAAVCNGRRYEMTHCFIFVVRDGLIREVRAFFDTALAWKQIFGDAAPRRLVQAEAVASPGPGA